jgi:hypothetical protein
MFYFDFKYLIWNPIIVFHANYIHKMSMNTMINESIQYLLGHTLFFEYNKIQKMIFTMGILLTF